MFFSTNQTKENLTVWNGGEKKNIFNEEIIWARIITSLIVWKRTKSVGVADVAVASDYIIYNLYI